MIKEFNHDKISGTDKTGKYTGIIKHAEEIVRGESNLIANLANISSLLKYAFDYFLWAGFYLYDKNADELVLGPFQGRLACTRIAMGRGVCGTSALERKTIIVEDVNKFPGHIFCDSSSKSEIVVPIVKNGVLFGVLDIDSGNFSAFDGTDKINLEELVVKILYLFDE
jgi:L-methionine (R)-S-oxide reductase